MEDGRREEEGHSLREVGVGSNHQEDCAQKKSGEWDACLWVKAVDDVQGSQYTDGQVCSWRRLLVLVGYLKLPWSYH